MLLNQEIQRTINNFVIHNMIPLAVESKRKIQRALLDEGEGGVRGRQLRLNIKNEDQNIQPHYFMPKQKGKGGSSGQISSFLALKLTGW